MTTVEVGQRWVPIDPRGGARLPFIIVESFGDSVVARWDHGSRLRVGYTVEHILANYRRASNPEHN